MIATGKAAILMPGRASSTRVYHPAAERQVVAMAEPVAPPMKMPVMYTLFKAAVDGDTRSVLAPACKPVRRVFPFFP